MLISRVHTTDVEETRQKAEGEKWKPKNTHRVAGAHEAVEINGDGSVALFVVL
jgi:hypothetical protein